MSIAPSKASLAAATALAARYAEISGALAVIEEERAAMIAGVNAGCDETAQPLLDEAVRIRAKLQPWWGKHGAALTSGRRKSVELGGCIIGTLAGRASLSVPDGGLEALQAERWGKPLVRITASIDKGAVLKALDGPRGRELAAMGFAADTPAPGFVLKRAEQGGVLQ